MGIGTVRNVFFGSLLRTVGTVVLALVIVTAGAFVTGVIGVPTLESVDNEFGEVTDEHTEILTELTVSNPNPFGLGSAEITANYTVTMNGVEMARGGGDQIELAPGVSTERFTTSMDNERIPDWWVEHIRNDEVTEVVLDATVSSGALGRGTDVTETRTIETDLVSSFNSDERRPIDANAPLVSDPLLVVEETRADWGDVDDRRTELDLDFDVYNPKSYDVPLSRLGYAITMNDVAVGDGETTEEHVLRSKEVTTVETTTRIDTQRLDDWWVTHVQRNEVTDLRIEFDASVGVAGTTVSLPLDALTYEETIETDILESKAGSDGTPEIDPSSGDDPSVAGGIGEEDRTTTGGGLVPELPLSSVRDVSIDPITR